MYNSKFIQIYQSLSLEELRGLRKWFNVYFVNKNDAEYKLFEFIESRRNITELSVNKERAFQYLFKQKKYDDLKMRHIMWLTTEVIEDFLAYHTFRKKRNLEKLQLLSAYQKKNLPLFTKETIDEIQKSSNKKQLLDSEYYYEQFVIEKEKYELATRNTRIATLNIQTLLDTFHHYMISELLKWSCIAFSDQRISNINYEIPTLQPILQLIEDGKYDEIPSIQVYYLVYKTLKQEQESDFKKLIETVYKYEKHFTETELKDVFLLCINYCIRKLNQSDLLYAEKAFELYLHAIGKKYFIENNELSRFSFSNIVSIGIKLKEFKKTENFIEQHQQYINNDFRENTVSFNLSKVWYAQKLYKKAMPTLLQTEFKDVIWNLNAKHLLLKMLYETQEIEILQSNLISFKSYILRQKKIGYHKDFFLQIIQQFHQLIKYYFATKRDKTILKNEILENKKLQDKDWLLSVLS